MEIPDMINRIDRTGYNPILYILSNDLIENKKITYIDIGMCL